jgi:hypothetical protein
MSARTATRGEEDVPSNRARLAEPMRVSTCSSMGMPKVRLESPIVMAEEGVDLQEVHDLSVIIKLRHSSRMSRHSPDSSGSETSGDSSGTLPWSRGGRAPGGTVSMDL